MNKIEANGRTLEEALQEAARQLGVSTDAVEYEVTEEGSKGILGFGQAPWALTAWVREGYRPPAGPAPAATEPMAIEEIGEEREPAKEAAPVRPQAPLSAAEADEFCETLMKTLGDILQAMELDAKPVMKSVDEEETVVDIVGKDVAILIGKHGQTLDALQYIVAIAANKKTLGRRRVILDAEGYRDRYRDMLERKALEYAEAVKDKGSEAVLDPQSARDRRIVHMALADNPYVYTYSEGEGEDRHVVISPKK